MGFMIGTLASWRLESNFDLLGFDLSNVMAATYGMLQHLQLYECRLLGRGIFWQAKHP